MTNGCDKISRFRHLNQGKCLNANIKSSYSFDKMLTLVTCNNSTETQQWVFRNGSYICTLRDQCLAIKLLERGPYSLFAMSYNEAVKSREKWSIDRRNQIFHFTSGWRLSYLSGDLVDAVEIFTTDEKSTVWSFEPILINGVPKCARGPSLPESKKKSPAK